MADTLPNVELSTSVWTDLYAESGIAVGTQLLIQNIGGSPIKIHAGATAPTPSDGYKVTPVFREATNESGDLGAWAISIAVEGLVNVAEA